MTVQLMPVLPLEGFLTLLSIFGRTLSGAFPLGLLSALGEEEQGGLFENSFPNK